jgi:hypothetical protein
MKNSVKDSQHTSVQLNVPELLQATPFKASAGLSHASSESRSPNILMHVLNPTHSLTCISCMMQLILTLCFRFTVEIG